MAADSIEPGHRALEIEAEANLLDTREHPRLVPYEGGGPSLPQTFPKQVDLHTGKKQSAKFRT